jgi:hypothetical protein
MLLIDCQEAEQVILANTLYVLLPIFPIKGFDIEVGKHIAIETSHIDINAIRMRGDDKTNALHTPDKINAWQFQY